MNTIDLTLTPLFDDLLSFQIEDNQVDLHNEYECRAVSFEQNVLSLSFAHTAKSHTVTLVFKDVLLRLLSIDLGVQDSTLDQFYRGRFNEQDDVLSTYDQQGRSYFYLNFYNEGEIQLLARSVTASLT